MVVIVVQNFNPSIALLRREVQELPPIVRWKELLSQQIGSWKKYKSCNTDIKDE